MKYSDNYNKRYFLHESSSFLLLPSPLEPYIFFGWKKGEMEVEGNDLVVIFIFFVSFFFLLFLFFGVKCVCVLRIFFFPLQLVVATIQNLQVKRKTEIKHLRIVNRLITSFVRSFVTRIVLFLSLSLSRARVLKCKKKRGRKRGVEGGSKRSEICKIDLHRL